MINRRTLLASSLLPMVMGTRVFAQGETVKIGLILPMTGPFASTGRQVQAGINAYQALHGTTAGGKTVEFILRDDAGTADQTRRIAQELVVNEGVSMLMGFGLTPLALAVAPVLNQAKIPGIITSATTSSIMNESPYYIRTSMGGPQSAAPLGDWVVKNGITRVTTIVTDYGPGHDLEKGFTDAFVAAGGEIVEAVRVPLANPDFAPFLQRVADSKPDAVFVFVPSGVGSIFMRQFQERGLSEAGIKLIGSGDVTEDDLIMEIGDAAMGAITGHFYSAHHDSPENAAYVAQVKADNNGMRPNFMSVGGYDAVHVAYLALEATGGDTNGDALIAAMKGQSWMSPRGPVTIDAETGDIIQDIYIREVKEVDGELYNVEFETYSQVSDPFR